MVFGIETRFKQSNVPKDFICHVNFTPDAICNSILEHLYIPENLKDTMIVTSELYSSDMEKNDYTFCIMPRDSKPTKVLWYYSDNDDKNTSIKYLLLDDVLLYNTDKLYKLYEKKDFNTLYEIFKTNFIHFPEDISDVFAQMILQTLKELKKIEDLETWCNIFSKKFLSIQYSYTFVEFCRTNRNYTRALETIKNIKKLIYFDSQYRPKNYEEYQIIQYKLLYEETIIYYYLGNEKKIQGMKKSMQYLLLPNTFPNGNSVFQNLKFYIQKNFSNAVKAIKDNKCKNLNENELLNVESTLIIKHKNDGYKNLEEWGMVSDDLWIVSCYPQFIVINNKGESHKIYNVPMIFQFFKSLERVEMETENEIVFKVTLLENKFLLLKLYKNNLQPMAVSEVFYMNDEKESDSIEFFYF
jgi:hypothetical protein